LRRVTKQGNIGTSLHSSSISLIFKRLAKVAGLPEAIGSQLSGHSARAGAAQDMAAAGIDLVSIMQAGGWQSPEIVGRYIENLDVMRGGSFRLAMQQRKNTPDGADR